MARLSVTRQTGGLLRPANWSPPTQGTVHSDESDSQIDAIIQLYQPGQLDQAHRRMTRNLQAGPDDGKQWELCGLIRHAQKDRTGAMDALERATSIVPRSAAGQCVLAQCYTDFGHSRWRRRCCGSCFLSPRCRPTCCYRSPPASAAWDNPSLLWKLAAAPLKKNVDGGQPFFGTAHYMQRLDYPLTLVATVLRKALELEPTRLRYRLALAKTLQRLGHNGEA